MAAHGDPHRHPAAHAAHMTVRDRLPVSAPGACHHSMAAKLVDQLRERHPGDGRQADLDPIGLNGRRAVVAVLIHRVVHRVARHLVHANADHRNLRCARGIPLRRPTIDRARDPGHPGGPRGGGRSHVLRCRRWPVRRSGQTHRRLLVVDPDRLRVVDGLTRGVPAAYVQGLGAIRVPLGYHFVVQRLSGALMPHRWIRRRGARCERLGVEVRHDPHMPEGESPVTITGHLPRIQPDVAQSPVGEATEGPVVSLTRKEICSTSMAPGPAEFVHITWLLPHTNRKPKYSEEIGPSAIAGP